MELDREKYNNKEFIFNIRFYTVCFPDGKYLSNLALSHIMRFHLAN